MISKLLSGARQLGAWLMHQDATSDTQAAYPQNATSAPVVAAVPATQFSGSQAGWLRVLSASELLDALQADKSLDKMWRQSRLSKAVWQRDLLGAIHRYAEFVQLMSASESHHHAHAGGLLAHTLEMLLAAMTWRNGHFLPENVPVETMDAQRDEWTYVVFFAALLHDVAKPMTDLRIRWRCKGMDEPLKWNPIAGALPQITQGRAHAEYLVEFTPKSLREYTAHARIASTLLHQIAPPTALSFLSTQPSALDALSTYLAGQDKATLVAKIVQRADQASTQQALLHGSKARFTTATSVPLIELLMQAMRAMLKSSALPLNRSGAAGWVFDGAVWFVAKRLADAVRQFVKQHAPDESIPGDNKNDRLFDTWQEYGCISLNPHTGQAVWYVNVQGHGENAKPNEADGSAYSHSLTVLRFPLDKLYDDPSQYPPAMLGAIEVKAKRDAVADSPDADSGTFVEADATDSSAAAVTVSGATPREPAGRPSVLPADAVHVERPPKTEPVLKAPSFNKPKPAAKPDKPQISDATTGRTGAAATGLLAAQHGELPQLSAEVDGFDCNDGFLSDEDDVITLRNDTKKLMQAPKPSVAKPVSVASKPTAIAASAATAKPAAVPTVKAPVARAAAPAEPMFRPLLASPITTARTAPSDAGKPHSAPVVLVPHLPELPHEATQHEPSATAISFIQWLQAGLAGRTIKYNETGAPVHFAKEGMALVSPLIFRMYAKEHEDGTEPEVACMQIQREVIKAGWHMIGPGKINIVKFNVMGRGGSIAGKLAAVVLLNPDKWVIPVPPINPVLQLA